MKYYYWIIFLVFFVVGCSSSSEDPSIDPETDSVTPTEDFSDFEEVTTDFKVSTFENPIHEELLEELNMCYMVDQDSTVFAACSPENFRVIPIYGEDKVKESFILQMKAGIVLKGQEKPLRERNILVFEREGAELVKVNGFRGEITSLKEGENGAKEMILTMYDPENECYFDCLFKWNGKQYSFETALAINFEEDNKGFLPIREDLRDSLSKDIYSDLMSQSIIY